MNRLPDHLAALESEAIHILRDGVAEARNPVMLFSGGKDSTVLADLALRTFHPARPPVPLLQIDSTWEFAEVLAFRDAFAHRHGFRLIVHANEDGRAQPINPFDHGDFYTTAMRTEPLKQALTEGGYDVVFGGARRDEEASRAKERIVSVRNSSHGWEPRLRRPELWRCFNWRVSPGETIRVVIRNGMRIVADDSARMRWRQGEEAELETVRFRTLGGWPVTAAEPSQAATIADVVLETPAAHARRRIGDGGSLERQKREGYFEKRRSCP